MTLALVIAALSVGLGIAVGLLGENDAPRLRPIQTFALTAALAVVMVQLLPEALAHLGLAGLGAFVIALAIPTLLEWLYTNLLKPRLQHAIDDHRLGLELAFIGLAVHQFGDGLALGTYVQSVEVAPLPVLIALSLHSIPVVALATLACRTRLGAMAAAMRGAGFVAATLVGIGVCRVIPQSIVHDYAPWATAAVSGLLVHIVAHDVPHAKHAERGTRVLDFLAFGAALLLVTVSMPESHDASGATAMVQKAVVNAWVELAFDTAPALLIGLAIAAALQIWGARLPLTWLSTGSPLRQATKGAVIGAPIPICACGVLPITQSLKTKGASAALVVAFLIATPELGIDSFALTGRFLGWPFAIIRLIAAVTVAIFTALAVARWSTNDTPHTHAASATTALFVADRMPAGLWPRFAHNLDELLYHIGPWTFAGLVIAAYVQAVLPDESLYHLASSGMDVMVITLFAIPSYVCAASATPLAAVLLSKGLSNGAALAALLLGPATNIATVGFLRSQYGVRGMLAGMAVLILSTWAFAYAMNLSPFPFTADGVAAKEGEHLHEPLTLVATALLAMLVLRSMWHYGIGAWFRTLGDFLAITDKEHDHTGHDHKM